MSLVAAPDQAAKNLKATGFLLLGSVTFTLEVVLLRYLGDHVPFAQIVLFRALAQILFAGVWMSTTTGLVALKTNRPGMHIVRGLFSLACWWLYYASFASLGIALATVLAFTSSLFTVLLAGPVMGEKVGLLRWTATLVGFTGVVIAAGLDHLKFDPAVIMALLSAAAGAGIVMSNRRLSTTESTQTIMVYIGFVTIIGVLPVAIWQGGFPSGWDIVLLSISSLTGCCGMWCNIEAYRIGEVSAIAPVPYIRLVFAALAGFVFFAEVPESRFWFGAVLIVAGALLIGVRRKSR